MNVQGPNFISITELNSTEPPSEALKLVPDIQFYIPVNLYPDNNPFDYNPIYYPYNSFPPRYQHLLALISGIAFQYPPSPLLSQFDDVPRNVFCNSSSIQKNCSLEFCSCVHRLKIPLDAVVELVVIDLGNY